MSSLVRKRGIKRLVNHLLFVSFDHLDQMLTTKEIVEFLKERGIYGKVEHAFGTLSTAWSDISSENERFLNTCIKYGKELEKEADEIEEKDEKENKGD